MSALFQVHGKINIDSTVQSHCFQEHPGVSKSGYLHNQDDLAMQAETLLFLIIMLITIAKGL